jgi:hypothetical protein
MFYSRESKLINFPSYLKISKTQRKGRMVFPKSGEIWVTKDNLRININATRRVSELYTLVMSYPELHWDTLVVTGVTVTDSGRCVNRWSQPLDTFLIECKFLKKK